MRNTTQTEADVIIAALRLWQRVQEDTVILSFADGGPCGLDYFEDISTNAGQHPTPSCDDIDVLLAEVFGIASD